VQVDPDIKEQMLPLLFCSGLREHVPNGGGYPSRSRERHYQEFPLLSRTKEGRKFW